jgi:hypothetical protein
MEMVTEATRDGEQRYKLVTNELEFILYYFILKLAVYKILYPTMITDNNPIITNLRIQPNAEAPTDCDSVTM